MLKVCQQQKANSLAQQNRSGQTGLPNNLFAKATNATPIYISVNTHSHINLTLQK